VVLWRPFWKWQPVEIFQCWESIQDIIIYPHIKFWWYRTMLNFYGIVVAILKMATSRNCSMSGINLGHHYLTTYQIVMISDNVDFLRYYGGHFENDDQYKLFNVWTQFGTSLSTNIWNDVEIGQSWIFAVLWWPFWKWRPVEIAKCRESIRDIIIYTHIKLWWYRTMLNFCDIVMAILKMATGRNFSIFGINSGHHNLPIWNGVEIGQC
jgi:hypothetical protein